MAIVLKRLQDRLRSGRSDFGTFSLDSSELSGDFLFTRLNAEPEDIQRAVFTLLMEEEASLILEYNTLRALVEKILLDPSADVNKAKPLMYELLELSQILTILYERYINDHPTLRKATLVSQQALYKQWLGSPVLFTFIASSEKERTWQDWRTDWMAWPGTFLTTDFSAEFTTQRMNPRRLYFIRERRLLLLLVPIIKDFYNYSSWIIWADSYVAPFLSYVGLLFFLPRLMFNLEILYTQLIVKSGKNELNLLTRFNAQWNRLWQNIINDAAWTTTGLLLFCVLVGPLQPLAIYFSVGMQFVDLVLVSMRAYYEIARFDKLIREYKNIYSDTNDEYIKFLEKSIERERSLFALACVNAFVVFFALSLTLVATLHPLLPLFGAVIAVCMTVINFEGREYFSIFKPLSVSRDFDKKLATALRQTEKSGQLIAKNSAQFRGLSVPEMSASAFNAICDSSSADSYVPVVPCNMAPVPQRIRSHSCPALFFSTSSNGAPPALQHQSSDEFIRTRSISVSSPRGINNNFSRDSTPVDLYLNAELKASLPAFLVEDGEENPSSAMPSSCKRGITT